MLWRFTNMFMCWDTWLPRSPGYVTALTYVFTCETEASLLWSAITHNKCELSKPRMNNLIESLKPDIIIVTSMREESQDIWSYDVSVFQTHEVQNKILYYKWNIQLTQNKQWITMNTKSTVGRNWAKSLKLYKIVQILEMFNTNIIAETT